ncbi:unnamed protein product [Mycena citricolor]|uniref:Uncharacterized protein n=1 Tax=Mycena citricolor TaxID=2018698 RepID=A0AAD2HNL7_9AGAR|nr:unnamed protein product [Mycena citricolor]
MEWRSEHRLCLSETSQARAAPSLRSMLRPSQAVNGTISSMRTRYRASSEAWNMRRRITTSSVRKSILGSVATRHLLLGDIQPIFILFILSIQWFVCAACNAARDPFQL